MNAPNFNRDDYSSRAPSVTANGSRSVTRESNDMTVKPDDLAAGDESGSDYRRLFFMYLGLALKYRWLILSISCVALMIGFIVTFVATPVYRATAVIQINREAPKVVMIQDATEERSRRQ